MKDPEVIEALGGHKVVAAAIGVTNEIAIHFARRAIPHKYRFKIAALAKRKKISLPADFLENQRKA